MARPPGPTLLPAGTPLQNDLAELQNLLHFLLPSVFAAQGFEDLADMLQVPAHHMQLHRRLCTAQRLQFCQQCAMPASPPPTHTPGPPRSWQGDDDEIAKLTERMKALLGPFVLRRLKTEVAGQLTTKSHSTGGRAGWEAQHVHDRAPMTRQ